ncbi:MAG: hypothetical protein ABJZ55_03330 [Fuerstiella sp.]
MRIRRTVADDKIQLLPLACPIFGLLAFAGCTSDTTAEPAEPPAEAIASHSDRHAQDTVAVETHQPFTLDRNDVKQHRVQHPLFKVSSARPQGFSEAVVKIVELNESIKAAFAANQEVAADDRLHELGRVLQTVNLLAEDADMTSARRESVSMAVVKLFEAFRAVDAAMHGEDGMSYEEASMDIEENLAVLLDAHNYTNESSRPCEE